MNSVTTRREGTVFTNILVPIDGTPQANVALPLARTVATSTGAKITLLEVAQPHAPSDRAAVVTHLDAIARELTAGGVSVTAVVREANDVSEEILRQVQEQAADLVIMRTHARVGIGRAVLGSVTQDVLARSQVPVLLLRLGGRRVTKIARLLVPIDGSPGGTLALGATVQLAKATGAQIQLVQVSVPASTWVYAGDAYGGMSYYDPAWDQEALESAQRYVAAVVARLHGAGIEASGSARQEHAVAECIVATAEEAQADLIVMTTRALTGPARALLGSTADAVVRTAQCPVLLLHRPDNADRTVSAFEPEVQTEPTAPPA
jgi:nucleotide-binding universal stress UspA family protein